MTGLAGRITVNPALLNNPSKLSVYSTSPPTAAGDTTRSDFLFSQLTSATFSLFAADRTRLRRVAVHGHDHQLSAAIPQPAGQRRDPGDAIAAGPGRRRQHAAAEIQLDLRRQHRHRNVEPDRAAEFLRRQRPCHVGGSEHDDRPCCRLKCKASKMSINSINYGASVLGQSVQNLNNQLDDAVDAALERRQIDQLRRHGRQRRLCDRGARAACEHLRLRRPP